MKLSILTTVHLFFLCATFCVAVTEYQLRILLNNGVAQPGMSCSYGDMFYVNTFVTTSRGYIRKNRLLADKQDNVTVDQEIGENSKRTLGATIYPATCKTTCKGIATGLCLAPACKGFRRDLEEEETDSDRDLQTTYIDDGEFWCDFAQDFTNQGLDLLTSMSGFLSPSCVKLLNAPRQMDCFIVTC